MRRSMRPSAVGTARVVTAPGARRRGARRRTPARISWTGAPRGRRRPRGCAPGRAAGCWWVCCWKPPLVAALRGGVAGLDSAARTRSRVEVPGVGAGIRDARHGGEFLSGVSAWGSSCCMLHPCLIRGERGCSSMVELQLPKLTARVRFPSPAPQERPGSARFRAFHRFRHRAPGPAPSGPDGRADPVCDRGSHHKSRPGSARAGIRRSAGRRGRRRPRAAVRAGRTG